MAEYKHPEVLVSTTWAREHLQDPHVRFVEIDVDHASYLEAHLPGAVGWAWSSDLCDVTQRDILNKEAFEQLMNRSGITPETTVVCYGDNNNWFAAWAFWQLKIYGHKDVRLMNGGRNVWLKEEGELELEIPKYPPTQYKAQPADNSLRALLDEVQAASRARSANLVDVRSSDEFSGKLLAPPGLPETCQRGGHIPGAANIPWGAVCSPDGTFKSHDELKALYEARGIVANKPTIAYCRIGERSSHTWFAIKYLLGYPDVKNYDGSWTEWGNMVRAPVER